VGAELVWMFCRRHKYLAATGIRSLHLPAHRIVCIAIPTMLLQLPCTPEGFTFDELLAVWKGCLSTEGKLALNFRQSSKLCESISGHPLFFILQSHIKSNDTENPSRTLKLSEPPVHTSYPHLLTKWCIIFMILWFQQNWGFMNAVISATKSVKSPRWWQHVTKAMFKDECLWQKNVTHEDDVRSDASIAVEENLF
jgi:hypothetical protein